LFCIKMLPAEHGDCLWIEYGNEQAPHRILIDCGTERSYQHLRERLEVLPPRQRRFELLIVTHLDADHIGGSLPLLSEIQDLKVRFADVWFNGWDQIAPEVLGYYDAKELSKLLKQAIDYGRVKWNAAFQQRAAEVADNPKEKLPCVTLKGNMHLTLLSPTRQELVKLRNGWPEALREAGLEKDFRSLKEELSNIPGVLGGESSDGSKPRVATNKLEQAIQKLSATGRRGWVNDLLARKFKSDRSVPNGSSIAVLAEYEGKSCLLTGDAFATTLVDGLRRLTQERGIRRLKLDALKVSHHGSRANINTDLLQLLKCRRYLFSSNGIKTRHPNPESVARVITGGGTQPTLFFNYKTCFNNFWLNENLKKELKYRVKFSKRGEDGYLEVHL
jgi:Metallo-beta-lactamase superfamily